MARTVSIGAQGFEELRARGYFYVDKTAFLREWWEGGDVATLVCRPRRFGKTLNLDTARCFLSTEFAGRGGELFGGLDVWADEGMRALQGTVPVVSLSFAKVKERGLEGAVATMKRVLRGAVRDHDYLRGSPALGADDRAFLDSVRDDMPDGVAADCLNQLCSMLRRHWGVRPVVLLDEYDTPMQEAWLGGYWDGMASFQRSLFNATFKSNPALGRALITGVTRVSRESIFSDLNNLAVVTTTSLRYQTAFGFTEGEVFAALDEFGLGEKREIVKSWYDGFVLGGVESIYNPWSITNYLKERQLRAFWANTSSNGLVSTLFREGDAELKEDLGTLLNGGTVAKKFSEQVVFSELSRKREAVWPLLLAAGYVTELGPTPELMEVEPRVLRLTNREVQATFSDMVADWFTDGDGSYGEFVKALLDGDADAMTDYLEDLALGIMSSFDSGTQPSRKLPERFWHGLVLGLLVDLRGRYEVRSNPESGRGRSDVTLLPLDGADGSDPAIVLEFKVFDERKGERSLADTVEAARAQIVERGYTATFAEHGIAKERVRIWGIAFCGKEVLVG